MLDNLSLITVSIHSLFSLVPPPPSRWRRAQTCSVYIVCGSREGGGGPGCSVNVEFTLESSSSAFLKPTDLVSERIYSPFNVPFERLQLEKHASIAANRIAPATEYVQQSLIQECAVRQHSGPNCPTTTERNSFIKSLRCTEEARVSSEGDVHCWASILSDDRWLAGLIIATFACASYFTSDIQ